MILYQSLMMVIILLDSAVTTLNAALTNFPKVSEQNIAAKAWKA